MTKDGFKGCRAYGMHFTGINEEALDKFIEDRGWGEYHTEEQLAKAISIEAAELLKNYQWGADWPHYRGDKEQNIQDETADLLIFLYYFCKKKDFNVDGIVSAKIAKNEVKYPIEQKNKIYLNTYRITFDSDHLFSQVYYNQDDALKDYKTQIEIYPSRIYEIIAKEIEI